MTRTTVVPQTKTNQLAEGMFSGFLAGNCRPICRMGHLAVHKFRMLVRVNTCPLVEYGYGFEDSLCSVFSNDGRRAPPPKLRTWRNLDSLRPTGGPPWGRDPIGLSNEEAVGRRKGPWRIWENGTPGVPTGVDRQFSLAPLRIYGGNSDVCSCEHYRGQFLFYRSDARPPAFSVFYYLGKNFPSTFQMSAVGPVRLSS